MTATATRPATEGHDASHDSADPVGGRASLLGSSDHKLFGLLFAGTGLALLVAALVVGLAVGIERVDPGSVSLLDNESDVLQLFALERFGLLFLGVLPIFVGLGLFLTPLQVGAPTVAFARAAASGFWMWLLGAMLQLASFGINGGPWGGEPDGVDLWLSSTILLLVGLLAATVSVVTTVVAHRAPGMSLRRVPHFSWSMLVAGSIWLATIPVLVSDLVLALVDHSNGRLAFGLNTELWAQVSWVLLAPSVLMLAVPALGAAADIIPVHAGAAQRWHAGVQAAIGALGVLTFGAWARPFVADDPFTSSPVAGEPIYQAFAVLAFLPLLLLLGGWADTFRRGRLRLSGPALASLLAALLLGAVLTVGVVIAIPATELVGTTATNGVATAAVLVAALGALGALGHWAPKLLGRVVPESAITVSALLVFLGGLVVLGAELVAGLYDQGATGFTGTLRDTAEAMGPLVVAGGGLAVLGLAGALLAVLTTVLGSGEPAGDDPWSGFTLEWATSSPPSTPNFAELPMVTSATPLLDARGDATSEEEAS